MTGPRSALLASTATIIVGAAWTLTASSAFLWGTGLWNAFRYPTWQWWQYLAVAGTNATVDFWLKASAGIATTLVGAAGWRLWWSLLRREKPLHGESHFASRREAEGSGITFTSRPSSDGILLGRLGRGPFARYACLPGQQHVAVYAPTEEGKGVSFVVPNAMNWGGRARRLFGQA